MESIDRLRDYALTAPAASMGSMARAIVAGMADDIEREVKKLTDERDLLKTQWEAGVDFDQRLEAAAAERADVTLFGVDYTPLPVDADDMPIHVGDVMEFSEFEIEYPVTRTVDGIGQGVFFAWCGERGYQQHDPRRYRHHHAPTVEDVLREFALKCEDAGNSGPEVKRLATEYAARLMLAGEE